MTTNHLHDTIVVKGFPCSTMLGTETTGTDYVGTVTHIVLHFGLKSFPFCHNTQRQFELKTRLTFVEVFAFQLTATISYGWRKTERKVDVDERATTI